MWALITGGFMFVMAVVFSLGKASSKREDATRNHREELLARSKDSETATESEPEPEPETEPAIMKEPDKEPIDQPENNKKSKTPHHSGQL